MMTRDITATPEYRQVFAWLRGGDTTPDPQSQIQCILVAPHVADGSPWAFLDFACRTYCLASVKFKFNQP